MEEIEPSKATPTAFIPRPLEVKDRPELVIFPLSILFVSFANIDGVDTSGRAVYWPDLDTFTTSSNQSYMRYLNQYGAQDYIDLRHSMDTGRYEGDKYVGGKHFSKSVGKDWRIFFIHLTAVGLADGEICEFEPLS